MQVVSLQLYIHSRAVSSAFFPKIRQMPRLSKTAVHCREQDFLIQVWGEMCLPNSSARFGKLRLSPKRLVWHTLIMLTASISQPSRHFPPPSAGWGELAQGSEACACAHTWQIPELSAWNPRVSKQLDLYPSQEAALRGTSGSSLYLVCCSFTHLLP